MFGISYTFGGKQIGPMWFHEDEDSRRSANNFYLELKAVPGVNNIKTFGGKKPAPKPEKKIALVAFKLYGYEVPADTKEGDFITVISGGQPVKLEVLKMTDERLPGISYVSAEEVIRK